MSVVASEMPAMIFIANEDDRRIEQENGTYANRLGRLREETVPTEVAVELEDDAVLEPNRRPSALLGDFPAVAPEMDQVRLANFPYPWYPDKRRRRNPAERHRKGSEKITLNSPLDFQKIFNHP